MFITTCTRPDRLREVPSYLYQGQKIVGLPTETRYGTFQIVDTGTDETYRSEYLRDRLNSGMFGAKLFDTLEEAEAYIETFVENPNETCAEYRENGSCIHSDHTK